MRSFLPLKNLFLIISIFASISIYSQTAVTPQGKGSLSEPYLISTWQELYWISQNEDAWSAYYKQTANIDFADATPAIETWENGKGWAPVGVYGGKSFTGGYDGGGFIISNIYIDRLEESYLGLFGAIRSGKPIISIGLWNVNITGNKSIASLAGIVTNATIQNCFATGSIHANSGAGLISDLNSCSITNCYSKVHFYGINGILNSKVDISTEAAGFAYSYWPGGGSISSSYSTGYLSADIVNGFAGVSSSKSYWDIDQSGTDEDYSGKGKTAAQMMNKYEYTDWSWYDWGIDPTMNGGYPYLKDFKSQEILLLPDIAIYNSDVFENTVNINGHIAIGKDAVSNYGVIIGNTADVSLHKNNYIQKNDFGALDSLTLISHTIEGLEFNTQYYAKFFAKNSVGINYSRVIEIQTFPIPQVIPAGDGSINSPFIISTLSELFWISKHPEHWDKNYIQIANIDFADSETSISEWNGGKGWNAIGSNIGTFTGKYDGRGYSISGLYINKPYEYNQGLFGRIKNATIMNIGITNANITGGTFVGLLVGNSQNSTIQQSFSTGGATGEGSVGGFIGSSSDSLTNCFSTADIIYTGTYDKNVGGFIGVNYKGTSNCYSIGSISDTSKNGFSNGFSTSVNSYWDIERSTTTTSDDGEGKTSAEMKNQNIYIDWDFSNIWGIDHAINEGYPYLQLNLKRQTPGIADIEGNSNLKNHINIMSNGVLLINGEEPVINYGIIVGLNPNITIENGNYFKKIDFGSSNSAKLFDTVISDLKPNTLFYIKYFTENNYGVQYSPLDSVQTSLIDPNTPIQQDIELKKGWNLVSLYIEPSQNNVKKVISNCIDDIVSIKTNNEVYSRSLTDYLNSLNLIHGGQAYFINAKQATTLSVTGTLLLNPLEQNLKKGWNLVGYPLSSNSESNSKLKEINAQYAKDFDGNWLPNSQTNSLLKFEPGRGYFIYLDKEASLRW